MSHTKQQESHPDWAGLEVELVCPRCGYNLWMLNQPRCPECGLTFDWDQVLATAEYGVAISLFEYRWRSHPLSSLVKTLILTLLPWRLWSRTRSLLDPRPKPLLVLILLTCLIYAFLALLRVHAWFWFVRPTGPVSGPYSPWDYWQTANVLSELGLPSLFAILFLLVTQLFWKTRARYHIRSSHILRIIILTWAGILIMRSLIEIVCAFAWGLLRQCAGWPVYYPDYLMGVAFVVLLVLSVSLALSVYLQVRRGWLWSLVLILSTAITTIALVHAGGGAFYNSADNPLTDMLHVWGKEWGRYYRY